MSKQAEAVNVLRTMTNEDLDEHLRQQNTQLEATGQGRERQSVG